MARLDQRPVTHFVPQRIVDYLKAVQIDEKQADLLSFAFGFLQCRREILMKMMPVQRPVSMS